MPKDDLEIVKIEIDDHGFVELQRALIDARKRNDDHVSYKGKMIPIEIASEIIQTVQLFIVQRAFSDLLIDDDDQMVH